MTVRESISRDILRLFVWFPLRWLIGAVPTGAAFYIFKLMGDLHTLASRTGKRKVAAKMAEVLEPNQGGTADMISRYYENHYVDRLHIFLYPRLTSADQIERYIRFENKEIIDSQLRSGKGVLMVQPHFGPVQITLLALALLGYNPLQIGFPNDKGLSRIGRDIAFKYRLRYESMLPAQILPADEYLGKAYRRLLKGGVVLTTGDGAGRGIQLGEHRSFNFLGSDRMIPLGPASWALKTGTALVPTFIVVEKYDRFRIVFEEPITGSSGDFERDRIDMTERFLAVTERYIRNYPSCWHFWDEI